MKIIALFSAGLIAIAAMTPVAAGAQTREVHRERVVTTEKRVVVANDRRHHGWRKHTRRVCRTEWRHHHRVRICRRVRW